MSDSVLQRYPQYPPPRVHQAQCHAFSHPGVQAERPFPGEFGPGYFFDEFESNFGIFLALKLGWVVGRK